MRWKHGGAVITDEMVSNCWNDWADLCLDTYLSIRAVITDKTEMTWRICV